jgi:acetylornithine deacetylase
MPIHSRPTLLTDEELLARLVAFDSTSRNSNLPIADFLCDYLDRPGVRITRNPSPTGDKVNLIVEIGSETVPGGGTGDATDGGLAVGPAADPAGGRPEAGPVGQLAAAWRPGLVMSGHMDVVPADEPEWESDPFTLADRGDRLVGRGACDMKGFLAVATNLALEALGTAAGAMGSGTAAGGGGPLRHPLALVFTYDEEVGTLGARRLVESCAAARALPSSMLIGEPTRLRVARAHKGHLRMRITLHGRPAHSGYPHLGSSAIEPAGAVICALARLRQELAAEAPAHGELFPEVPFVPLNVGTVHGGSAINVVPDRCVVEVGLRPLPGYRSQALVERVTRAAQAAAAPLVPEVEVLSDSLPLLAAAKAPLLRRLYALVGQTEDTSASYATDAGWLQQLGMDCVLFGPGSIDHAHRPNEHVSKADLAATRTVVARLIGEMCGAKAEAAAPGAAARTDDAGARPAR